MRYMGDKEYWDKKFTNRDNKPLNPETAYVKAVSMLCTPETNSFQSK